VAVLEERADIDADRIGLWGISQAGYVMPRLLSQTDRIAFVIAVSCPGQPGVEQGAFLMSEQARCAGASEEEVRRLRRHFSAVEYAATHEEYLQLATALRGIPAFDGLERLGVRSEPQSEDEWHPPNLEGDYFRDPMDAIARTTIPVLAFFGELDTQADPYQGAQAYRDALALAGNPASRVVLLPDADHNLIVSETGCLGERNRRSRRGWRDYAPDYLDILEQWLRELREPGPSTQGGLRLIPPASPLRGPAYATTSTARCVGSSRRSSPRGA
jgi:pimeloyl-ACP methyl ester carboxylesterase